ncbi:MAG: HAD-IIA family hydrolase [Clostridium sp.]|nr:HAD-IIA family hydrolase [Clostridium sp.]
MVPKRILKKDVDEKGILKTINCFALDMDGTVYLGEKWIEGAVEFLEAVEKAGKSYVFLTNNSSKSPKSYLEKLERMGLKVGLDKIVTSGMATIDWLKIHLPGKRVFLLGNEVLKQEFEEEGIVLDEETPEAVVVGFDTSLTYDKMSRVCALVREGLPYISTHPDYNCPTEKGYVPDAGAIQAFIYASAFRYPDHIIGKPNSDIMDYLARKAKAGKKTTAMVGDRLYTDVAAGVSNGYRGILVLSGESRMEDVESSKIIPDLIFTSVKEMIPYL